MGFKKQDVSEFDYTIATPAESGDYRDAVIEKEGLKVQFTVADVEADRTMIAKQMKENKGQLVLEAAKIENITTNHPFVLDLTEEQLFTCALLQECMKRKEQAEKNIKILQDQDEDYAKEVAAIMSKLGFVETSVPTTEEVATEPVEAPVETSEPDPEAK